jgi:hypothetical protein
MSVTHDTGALTAADRNDRAMWALHAGLLTEEVTPTVPSPVVAEAWQGRGQQANLSRFLALCDVEDLTFDQAKAVGVLVGHHDDIVRVTVVEGITVAALSCRPGQASATRSHAHGGWSRTAC